MTSDSADGTPFNAAYLPVTLRGDGLGIYSREGGVLRAERQEILRTGGADRDRTCDLLIANETLYQLSYDPTQNREELTKVSLRRTQAEILDGTRNHTENGPGRALGP